MAQTAADDPISMAQMAEELQPIKESIKDIGTDMDRGFKRLDARLKSVDTRLDLLQDEVRDLRREVSTFKDDMAIIKKIIIDKWGSGDATGQ
jgi:chromosome segregation ATPase